MFCLAVFLPGPIEALIVLVVVLLLYGRHIPWLFHWLRGDERKAKGAERQVGDKMAKVLLRKTPADDNKETRRFVQSVGADLARASSDTDTRFRFTVVRSDRPNANAVLGGSVLVRNSLVELCQQDRDEIGFALAHEMAHILLAHPRGRMFTRGFILLLAWRLLPVLSQLKCFREFIERLLLCAYSRGQELAADRKAVGLMKKAKLDPTGAVRILERLKELSQTRDASGDTYLSTHPPVRSKNSDEHQVQVTTHVLAP